LTQSLSPADKAQAVLSAAIAASGFTYSCHSVISPFRNTKIIT